MTARTAEARVSRGLWSDAISRLRRNKPAMVGLVLIVVFIGVAFLAPLVAPYGPYEQRVGGRLEPPGPAHLFGTDVLGRDMFSRVLFGAQISLQVGVTAVVMALVFGGILGSLAGRPGGARLSAPLS